MPARALAALAALATVLVASASSAAAAPDDWLARLSETVRRRLDDLAAARAPKLVPPTPVAVTWKAVRLGSFDLDAPLVAMVGADLDGDGKGELYAVTARDVVAFTIRGSRAFELGRVPFAGERAVPAPREIVGTAIVDGNEVVAASSAWAKDLRVTLAGKVLAAQPGSSGFLMCPQERWQLVPGRNYFTTHGEAYGLRCRELVDRQGTPVRVRAQLSLAGKLAVDVQRCPPGAAACEPAGTYEHAGVGIAHEIADVDRDGTPELIVSGYVPPGDPDVIKVIVVGGDDKKPKFKKPFSGGVAAIAVLQTSPKEPAMVIAAVRLAGATRVDLWRLN